jgi:DnaJ-class molecular chaperone
MMQILDKTSDPKIRINNKIVLKKSYLNGNEKITEYQEGKPCAKCHMIMDAGEKSPCKYCRGDWDE